jgi:hypothetical protein
MTSANHPRVGSRRNIRALAAATIVSAGLALALAPSSATATTVARDGHIGLAPAVCRYLLAHATPGSAPAFRLADEMSALNGSC